MKVGIIGGGQWGRALATLAAEAGHEPRIGYRGDNPRGFQGTPNLAALCREVELVIFTVPARDLRESVRAARPGPGNRVVLATRGLEPDSGRWLSEIVIEESRALRVGALAGPAIASEVVARRPSAMVVASPTEEVARLTQEALHSPLCRIYTSGDLLGVELAGALVRVLSVALGLTEALQLGVGVQAVILTRGLAEGRRLGRALGAEEGTFAGLAGVGDLVASGRHPDHPGFARGQRLAREGGTEPVVVQDAEALLQLAARHKVNLPLTEAIAAIAAGKLKARLAIDMLMRREATAE
jgi:glycerol-3-phosphate dehydrogenase (NAD(P)+)